MSPCEREVDVENSRRLQHSPSLPNLCTTPQGAPTPQSLRLKPYSRQTSPPSHVFLDLATSTTPTSPVQLTEPPSEFKIRLKAKSHTHLITPPLTPHSSLRSESSGAETSLSASDDRGADGPTSDSEPVPSSHFLLVSGVPKHVSTATLKSAFFNSFALHSAQAENPNFQPTVTENQLSNEPKYPNPNDNPIKGIYVRFQVTNGIVILGFYDSRDAAKTKRAIEVTGVASLAKEQDGDPVQGRQDAEIEASSDGDETGGDQQWKRQLTCSFITPKELRKLIGKSSFVTETDGGFFISPSDSSANFAEQGATVQKRVLAVESLKNMLGSFGPLCRFDGSTRTSVDEDEVNVGDETQVFWAEFYDVRDAGAARAALNGRTMFGVKLRLFGRDGVHDGENGQDDPSRLLGSLPPSYPSSTPTSTSFIPFPTSPVDQTHEPSVNDRAAVTYDAVAEHERFLVVDRTERVRPRSVSAGNDSSSSTDSSSILVLDTSYPSSPSRTLYSSHLPSPSASAQNSPQDLHGRRSSNHLFFDAVGKPTHGNQERSRSLNVDIPVDVQASDEQDAGDAYTFSPAYSQQQSPYCYNMPSESMHFYSPFYGAPSPIPPPPPPAPAVHFPITPSPTTGYGYHPEPVNLNSWPWTPAGPAPTGMAAYFMPGPHQLPTSQPNGMYYPHQPHLLPFGGDVPGHAKTGDPLPYESAYLRRAHHLPYPQPYTEFFPSSSSSAFRPPSPTPRSHNLLHHARLSEPPEASNATLHPSAHSNAGGALPERNQLNIASIEDGLDTRTTVMVKNIPNKMSDRDLITYIGNVCPRKIDFLYLRMDFQNGCNVGYAFVNFIYVEDLLKFAREKLGVKWNMFSSEKVLQMSYANYQGKEALVEKFKNSCIMDEREAWRPKIFHSEPGASQGLPEPFPAPTHLRRKERSSINRGALFISGVGNGGSHHLHNNVSSRGLRSNHDDPANTELDSPPDTQADTSTRSSALPTSITFKSKRSNHHSNRLTR